jgi:phosphonate degradation associated HDIG domain protein
VNNPGRIDQSLRADLQASPSAARKTDLLFAYMQRKGGIYYDRSVTQLEHALQCARLARREGSAAQVVTAALLHDIGHFLLDEHNETADFQHDDLEHEVIGADYMVGFLPGAIVEPIRLHVPAKRYLCAVEPEYRDGLSAGSKKSLELQGGPMSDEERREFARHPHLDTAVRLRRWDDQSKVERLETPPLEAYRADVEASFEAASSPSG